jgi:hypothetical protein
VPLRKPVEACPTCLLLDAAAPRAATGWNLPLTGDFSAAEAIEAVLARCVQLVELRVLVSPPKQRDKDFLYLTGQPRYSLRMKRRLYYTYTMRKVATVGKLTVISLLPSLSDLQTSGGRKIVKTTRHFAALQAEGCSPFETGVSVLLTVCSAHRCSLNTITASTRITSAATTDSPHY